MEYQLLCEKQAQLLSAPQHPRLSWCMVEPQGKHCPDDLQTAYRVRVATSAALLDLPDIWDSGKVAASQCADIILEATLSSNTRYFWQVEIWDGGGSPHKSDPAWFETGLLSPEDWKGTWICGGEAYRTNWAVLLRRAFDLRGAVEHAKIYVSGLGCYELTLNGVRVGDHMLDPAQTEYRQKILYASYDVTSLLLNGANALGATLGDGWYHQSLLMEGDGIYGEPCLLLQLDIRFKNGIRQIVTTDRDWKAAPSPISWNNLYCGETYDARLEQPGWDLPGFSDGAWIYAKEDCSPKGQLSPQLMPPMRVTEQIRPVAVTCPQAGVCVYDFGVNFAGIVELAASGCPGREITLRFGESLDSNGMVDVDSTGVFHIQQVQTLRYIFGKPGEIRWRPKFTYFGFRYVEATGLPFEVLGQPSAKAAERLTGLRVHTDLETTGAFACSMPVLNQMHTLLQNTFRSNIHGLPTDCPAREKCGWTGDANTICDTSVLMWDSQLFWEKYIEDMIDAHREYGVYRNVVPGRRGCGDTVPPWGAALIIIPWNLYEEYGCATVLQRYYGEMAAYLEHMEKSVSGNLYTEQADYALADWCAPYGYKSETHFLPTAGAYYYKCLCILAKTAQVLKKPEDARRYAQKADLAKEAFLATHYDAQAHTFGTQTLNAFCEDLGLCPVGEAQAMADWTAQDIQNHGGHITCGHLGIRYIYEYLNRHGFSDLLAEVLNARDYPSFGAQLALDATTLWETFELERHGQSLNHPFRGGFSHWFYRDILGIRPQVPGYEQILIRPSATALIPWAKGSIKTVRGTIGVDYRIGDHFQVTVPPNVTAEVEVPDGHGGYTRHRLGSGVPSL